jgi:hypothetical protein
MIGPLTRVALKGFLWYQGESNSGITSNRDLYNCTFPAMIDAWRQVQVSSSLWVDMLTYWHVNMLTCQHADILTC